MIRRALTFTGPVPPQTYFRGVVLKLAHAKLARDRRKVIAVYEGVRR